MAEHSEKPPPSDITDDPVKATSDDGPYEAEFVHGNTSEAARLAELGYKAELPRNLSLITVLGLSFSIIAAPFGLSTSVSFSLINGGAPTYFFGWLFLSIITLAMAASLGELCSAWPTSGGVYVWSANVSPQKYKRIVSFCTGWVNIVANVTLALSIAFGEAQLILGAVAIWKEDDWTPAPWVTVLTFWAVMVFCTLVNLFGIKGRYLESLNTASMYWSSASVIVILIVLLVKAGTTTGRRSAHDAFVLYQNTSGWTDGWSFFVGCLTSAYTLTGYGLIAQCCEEVARPERAVPRAMVGSVLAASLTGLMYILPVIFVLPENLDEILHAGSGVVPALFRVVVGSEEGGFGLLFLLLVIGMFASIGGLTVALRFTWAFSRDGGEWQRSKSSQGFPMLTSDTSVFRASQACHSHQHGPRSTKRSIFPSTQR